MFDFEGVAAHEIGHALGYLSTVDTVDVLVENGLTGAISPRTLDLFRFENGTGNDPSTLAEFTTFGRNLTPGGDHIFDQIDPVGLSDAEYRMSTGRENGDGRQASHWKDDTFAGVSFIGIMDPTLSSGFSPPILASDLRTLDLIGYEIQTIPEPVTIGLMVVALIGLRGRRARR